MLDISAAALSVLDGSYVPQVKVDAWYDGELVLEDVPWSAGQLGDDTTRDLVSSGSMTSVAPDSSLIPSSWDAPLACFGSELQVRVGVPLAGQGVEWFSLGWYVIEDFGCTEWYQPYEHSDGTIEWVVRGTQVENTIGDRWQLVDQAAFATPEQPASLTSVIAEIKRLVDGIVDVSDLSGITDQAIPDSVVYSDSRATAVSDLAAVLALRPRMSRDGTLDLVPIVPASMSPVWTVTINDDEAVARIRSWTRKGDRSGLYNQFVSSGTSVGGTPVQGVVTTDTGPLRFGGPFGQVPLKNNSALLTTIEACSADAARQQQKYGGGQTVLVPANVPANPALEVDDVIALELPNRTLTGPVATIDRTLGQVSMDVTVRVSREALWGVGS
jgi:hypothetical protein